MKTLTGIVAAIAIAWIAVGLLFWHAFCRLGYYFTVNRGTRRWD